MLELLQQFLIAGVVSYLSFTHSLSDRIQLFFSGSEPDEEFIALHPAPLDPTTGAYPSGVGVSDILRRNPLFQQAALMAAQESPHEYAAPSSVDIEELLSDALVNVYCQYKTDRYIRTTTGTGFFVNPNGVILTNAHVAQFLLLEEGSSPAGDVECVIRTGDPAAPRYEAELLYISPTWILNNASLITQEQPRGTGERDYALLYVSGPLDAENLPERFPSLPLNVAFLPRSIEGKEVLVGGYPAGALLREGSTAALLPVIARSSIGSLYTFGSNYADLFAVADSPLGEEGASGGPILDAETGQTIGLIVTRGDATEGARSLRALTLSYLDRTIHEETGFSLIQNMQGDISARGDIFKTALVPLLAQVLNKELEDRED